MNFSNSKNEIQKAEEKKNRFQGRHKIMTVSPKTFDNAENGTKNENVVKYNFKLSVNLIIFICLLQKLP